MPGGVRIARFGMDVAELNAFTKNPHVPLKTDRSAGTRVVCNLMQSDRDKPQGRVGQQHREFIADPNYLIRKENFDATVPQFAGTQGFQVSPILQALRSAIAAEGLQGIATLAKRLGLSAAMIGPLAAVARDFGMLLQEDRKDAPPGLL